MFLKYFISCFTSLATLKLEMGQDNDSNDSAKEFAKALSIIIFACFIGAAIKSCCLREKKKKVVVLCVRGSEDYIKAFKSFIKRNFALNAELGTGRPENGKYLVLCNVVSRIPEDIIWVFESLDIKDVKRLDDKMMIVAMHKSEGGKRDAVSSCIGTPEHPLYGSKLTNIFYCKKKPVSCDENKKAIHDIKSFLA